MDAYSNENIERLAGKHIARYHRLLAAHARGDSRVRPAECQQYLTIWKAIQAKVRLGDRDFSKAEWQELHDAVDAGE
jgi:hypothetical protein